MIRSKSVRMVLAGLSLLLCLGAVVACGSKSTSGAAASKPATTSSAPANAGCQHVDSVKFDKTKFVLHAGLAFGAFHHWIYKPFKSGGFKKGAKGRVAALVKAAAAGAFTVHEMKIAKQDAESSPTLCKIVAPIDRAEAKLSGMSGTLRSGNATDADINGVNSEVNTAQQAADKNGVQTPDQVPSDKQLAGSH